MCNEREALYYSILDDAKELAIKLFWNYSDILGLRNLFIKFSKFSLKNDNFIIWLESIGEILYKYIIDADYKVIFLNSYQTTKFRDFSTCENNEFLMNADLIMY